MKNTKFKIVCLSMALIMTSIPHLAVAEMTHPLKMIPTNQVVFELSRTEAQTKIDNFLQQENVRQQLLARGVSIEEAHIRLASLSTTEMNTLVSQMNEARAGGDILVTILVIVLIIFLIQRI